MTSADGMLSNISPSTCSTPAKKENTYDTVSLIQSAAGRSTWKIAFEYLNQSIN